MDRMGGGGCGGGMFPFLLLAGSYTVLLYWQLLHSCACWSERIPGVGWCTVHYRLHDQLCRDYVVGTHLKRRFECVRNGGNVWRERNAWVLADKCRLFVRKAAGRNIRDWAIPGEVGGWVNGLRVSR